VMATTPTTHADRIQRSLRPHDGRLPWPLPLASATGTSRRLSHARYCAGDCEHFPWADPERITIPRV
jgi:hypothetical protein